MRVIALALAAGLACLAGHGAQGQTGREVAQRMKDRPDGKTRQSELVMRLINKRGSVRERRLLSYSIDVGAEGRDRKSIMFFQYPGDVKGTGFLTWDYDAPGKEDDKWLYLPAMKKTRRISGASAKQDYFMGSDFTYDDMGGRHVDEDTHTLLGEEVVDGHKCWRLESVPKDGREIYSRRVTLVRQDCLLAVRVEYYDKMGKLHRELSVSEIAQVQGYWVGRRMQMTNVQTRHQTVLEFTNLKYDEPLEDSKFSVSTLESGRF